MRTTLISVLAVAAPIYAALCAFLYFTQRSQLYFPTPASRDVHPLAERLLVPGADVPLHVWRIEPARAQRALLYFGGNAEDVSLNIDAFARAFPGTVIYLSHYRGYGGSAGKPTEQDLFNDAATLFDHARAAHPGMPIDAKGRSLGSGVAVHLAAERPVERLVLVTPFDSLALVAAHHFPVFPVRWLLRDRFESAKRVAAGEVAASTLIVLAEDDEVVPVARGEALAAAFAPSRVELLRLRGATHNSVDLYPQYLGTVARFIGAR